MSWLKVVKENMQTYPIEEQERLIAILKKSEREKKRENKRIENLIMDEYDKKEKKQKTRELNEAKKDKQKEWKKAHKEQIKQFNKIYYEENKEAIKKQKREKYYAKKENKEI